MRGKTHDVNNNMTLFFFIEARIPKLGDKYYLPDMFGEKIMARYLEVFDSIKLVCRVYDVNSIAKGYKELKDTRISVVDLPVYNSILEYMRYKGLINSIIEKCAYSTDAAFLCRVPGQVGTLAATILKKNGKKYGVEVVGDPWESFAPQAFKHKLALIMRFVGTYNLKKTVKGADAALYVTEYVLQKKYPVKLGVYSTNASNVELLPEYIAKEFPISMNLSTKNALNFMSIGTLAQLYKAPDVVLKALAEFKQTGRKFKFTWFGDGQYKHEMIELSRQLGLSNEVEFVGNVSHESIIASLKNCDVLIHASRAEGLPRAVIEAMASAVPIIGSRVAGIPELLLPEAIVPINNVQALFEKIIKFTSDDNLALANAVHNLTKSREYVKSALSKRRLDFYKNLRELY